MGVSDGHLFDSTYGSRDMSLDTMTEGISVQGMRNFTDLLKAKLLTGVCEQLEKTDGIGKALQAGWQGESRDVFMQKFTNSVVAISRDLTAEYNDLMNRLGELLDSYYEQDKKMMDMF